MFKINLLSRIILFQIDMFKARTIHSGKFKALFDNLFQHVVTVNFTITQEGLFLQENTNQNITLSLQLPAHCFEMYEFSNHEPIHIGLGKNINEDVFKHVQSKDILTISMINQYEINFDIENVDGSGSLVSIQIESVQNTLPLDEPQYEEAPFVINNNLFKQICNINTSTLDVVKNKGQLMFQYNTGRCNKIIKAKNSSSTTQSSELVHQIYNAEQFRRINKISSLIEYSKKDVDKGIELCMEKDKPLYIICCSIIGTIKFFIYSTTEVD